MPSKLIKRISPRSGLLVLQRVVDKNFALGRSTNDDRNKANLEYGWFWFKEPFGRIFRHDQGAHKAPWREFNTELILRSRSLSSLQFGPDSDFHHRSGDHRHPLAPAPRRDRKCPRPVDGTASMPSGRLLGSQKDRSESSLFNLNYARLNGPEREGKEGPLGDPRKYRVKTTRCGVATSQCKP